LDHLTNLQAMFDGHTAVCFYPNPYRQNY
jgi:hypothetical protein